MARGTRAGKQSGGRWYFAGGGKAHAKALRILGYDCVHWDQLVRIMRRDGVEISVPVDPDLTRQAIQRIVQQAAGSRDEYERAWNAKKDAKLGCPEQEHTDTGGG